MPNTMNIHSENAKATDFYFQSLSFPPVSTIGQLLGKSNFKTWRSSIEPVLLRNPHSSKVILGEWSNPRALASGAVSEQERDEWHMATMATCRFIRATLALNVAPFVRQHNTAKALYLNLIWLYGPEAGIDTQGGPAISPGATLMQQDLRRTREGLLAAMESKTPFGEITVPARALYSHPHPPAAHAQCLTANLGSGLSTTSLVLTAAATTTPTLSESATHVSRSDSQVLPAQVKPTTAVAPSVPTPPPLTVVHVYERMRVSPDPSLQTIHEEPHPGTRVSFSRAVDTTTDHDVSPVSPCGTSDEDGGGRGGGDGDDDDDDGDSLSPLDDTDEEDMSVSRQPRSKKSYGAEVGIRERSRSLFARNTLVATPSTNESSKARRLSFSFPLRKLNKNKKTRGEEKKKR
ncbi:hypothetical protein PV08_06245 [Exophiala spinifera]|uniref:Uncharacterized protein n=1 Tax=Exophiala spinifera TaxID=91928 RepID=A0A0D2BY13_9EURO|nr:uncharacterized protein PV08_06245 [Exophiala spinifera]KIW16194.1 hypothetical protein PV08_06245 [Exophiala spinifera]